MLHVLDIYIFSSRAWSLRAFLCCRWPIHLPMLMFCANRGIDCDTRACRLAALGARNQRPASIADTFWRPERKERTYAQTVLDETLIQKMDVEYGDDEIGSLNGDEGATRGMSFGESDGRVQAALEDFLKNYRNDNRVVCPLPCTVFLVAWHCILAFSLFRSRAA
jgi:hypothetical protein